MRTIYAISLIATLLFGTVYWYGEVQAVCQIPFAYRLGELDERFDLTADEARLAITEAEALWEDATGMNLFTYDEEADFAINFIFDDRQAMTDAERQARDQLDAAQAANQAFQAEYQELVDRYETLQAQYEQDRATYEANLSAYNVAVEEFNQSSEPDQATFAALEQEKQDLDAARDAVNAQVSTLRELSDEINAVSAEGNEFIERYNQRVATYNEVFGTSREFTQGDYQGDKINIYTFADRRELVLVLAHELGHALSIGHVDDPTAIMHFMIGGQTEELTIQTEDVAGFEAICGDTTDAFLERLYYRFGLE